MDTVVSLLYESLASAKEATLHEYLNIMITTCICITIIVIMVIKISNLSTKDTSL